METLRLDAILKPMYGNFLRNGHSHREAGPLSPVSPGAVTITVFVTFVTMTAYLDWLGHITRAPVPKSIERFDKDFHKLIVWGPWEPW